MSLSILLPYLVCFKVSSFLQDHGIGEKEYAQVIRHQYEKKFGRFGEAVVESNMTVMSEGFKRVQDSRENSRRAKGASVRARAGRNAK